MSSSNEKPLLLGMRLFTGFTPLGPISIGVLGIAIPGIPSDL
jgi:hypothetical protein